MQELEKILEEIDDHAVEFELFGSSDDYISVGWVKEIIRKHMKNKEDILKFYYCESEDDYYLGQRVQNMYYAKYGTGGFTWFMSRYLPWGTDGYPSEPKEIPFVKWIEGFIRKHINDGWIPVEERLPEVDEDVVEEETIEDDECPEYLVTIRGESESTVLKYSPDGAWFDENGYVYDVIAWQPLPETYHQEGSDGE